MYKQSILFSFHFFYQTPTPAGVVKISPSGSQSDLAPLGNEVWSRFCAISYVTFWHKQMF